MITKGKWVNRGHLDVIEEKSGFGICHIGDERELRDADYNVLEAEANAQLIAEAGTVANETGLSPRELLNQNNELMDALKEATETIKMLIHGQQEPYAESILKSLSKKLKQLNENH